MATIVPTTEEDPALSVVRFVSQLAWADAGAEVPSPPPFRGLTDLETLFI